MLNEATVPERHWKDGLYYVDSNPSNAHPRIFWVELNGARRTPVSVQNKFALDPELNHAGNALAFAMADVSTDGNIEIFRSDPAGNAATRCTYSDANVRCFAPTWSPDGRYIAYSRWKLEGDGQGTNLPASIWLFDTNTNESSRVCDGICPGWHPDGKSLIVTRPEKGMISEGALWIVRLGEVKGRRFLKRRVAMGARWSADGKKVCCSIINKNLEASLVVTDKNGHIVRELPHSNTPTSPESEWIWAKVADYEPSVLPEN